MITNFTVNESIYLSNLHMWHHSVSSSLCHIWAFISAVQTNIICSVCHICVRFIFTTVLTLVSILSGCWTSGFGSPKRIFLNGGPNSSWTGVLLAGTNAGPIPSRYCSALQICKKFFTITLRKITYLQYYRVSHSQPNPAGWRTAVPCHNN